MLVDSSNLPQSMTKKELLSVAAQIVSPHSIQQFFPLICLSSFFLHFHLNIGTLYLNYSFPCIVIIAGYSVLHLRPFSYCLMIPVAPPHIYFILVISISPFKCDPNAFDKLKCNVKTNQWYSQMGCKALRFAGSLPQCAGSSSPSSPQPFQVWGAKQRLPRR